MSNPIPPTVGRTVLFRSPNSIDIGSDPFNHGPVPAIITKVWSDDCVNLQIMRDNMEPLAMTSVTYSDVETPPGPSWHWMDFQLGQARAQAA
jgi:hypothetical protein